MSEEIETNTTAYVVTFRRLKHMDPKVTEAKRSEIEKFKRFSAFKVVDCPVGKKVLGTSWVVTEKEKYGKSLTKARLCVRGDQEEEKRLIATQDDPRVTQGDPG